jgi:hypothetical protein
MADPKAWRVVEAPAEPARRVRGRAGAALADPAYRQEVA